MDKLGFYYYIITDYDVASLRFMSKYRENDIKVCNAVRYGMLGQALDYYGEIPRTHTVDLNEHYTKLPNNSYFMEFSVNTNENFGFQRISKRAGTELLNMTSIKSIYENEDIIYDNGESIVYYKY